MSDNGSLFYAMAFLISVASLTTCKTNTMNNMTDVERKAVTQERREARKAQENAVYSQYITQKANETCQNTVDVSNNRIKSLQALYWKYDEDVRLWYIENEKKHQQDACEKIYKQLEIAKSQIN